MGKFLKFEKMITPFFIQLIFWIGTIIILIFGFITMASGFMADSQFGEALNVGTGGKAIGLISGIFIIIVGPVILRIYCEILIVIFKLQGAMVSTRDLMREQNALLERTNHRTPPPTPPSPPRQTRQAPSPGPTRQAPSKPDTQSGSQSSDIPPEFLE